MVLTPFIQYCSPVKTEGNPCEKLQLETKSPYFISCDALATADFDDVPVWKCKSCGQNFNLEKEFANHIMEHLSVKNPSQARRGRPRKNPPKENLTEEKEEGNEIEVKLEPVLDIDAEFIPKIIGTPSANGYVNKRVQPRRSLKGKRSAGYMADFIVPKTEPVDRQKDEAEKNKKSENVDEKGKDVTQTPKKGRGRPKKNKPEVSPDKDRETVQKEEDSSNSSSIGTKSRKPLKKLEEKEEEPIVEKEEKRLSKERKSSKRNVKSKRKKDDIENKEEEVNENRTTVETEDVRTKEREDVSNTNVTELCVVGIPGEENAMYRVEIEQPTPKRQKLEENKSASTVEGDANASANDDSDKTSLGNSEMQDSIDSSIEEAVKSLASEINEIMPSESERHPNSGLNQLEAIEKLGEDNTLGDMIMNAPNQKVDFLNGDLVSSLEAMETDDTEKEKPNSDEELQVEEDEDKMKNDNNSKNKHTCPYCKKKFFSKHYLKLHLPRHTGKFKCYFCGFFYARKESLMKHECKMKKVIKEIIDEDSVSYACSRCGKQMDTIEAAREHFVEHSKEKVCTACEQTFANLNQYNEHNCPRPDRFECEICRQRFPNQKGLFRHMANHTDMFKCNGCDKTYARKDSLIKHMLICCPDKTGKYDVFACKKCRKGFATKLGVENHEARCTKDICTNCQKVFDSTELLCKHIPTCKGEDDSKKVRYSCNICGKSFQNQAYLIRHQETHTGKFQCPKCEKVFIGNEELKKHQKFCTATAAIQEEGSIRCDICFEEFTSAKYYKDHYIIHTHKYHCEKCGKYFKKIGTLHSHLCQVVPNSERCPICGKMFSSSKYCMIHQKIQHNIKLNCNRCNNTFEEKRAYLYHMCIDDEGRERPFNKITTEIEKHVCHVCGRDFVSTSNLNKHMKIHGEKNIECPICHKRFHHAEYLKVHIEGKHEKRQKFQCSHCGKVLTSKPGLVTHIKNFHAESKVVYPCPKCGKMFTQKGNLKTHMYSHATERAFRCSYCQKTFKYPDQLNKHLLTHTMEQKLECEICEKQFTKEYDLKRHKETFHSGMMYVCHICGSRCGHRHTLFRHYKRKHPVDFDLMKNDEFVNSLFQQVDKFDSLPMTPAEIQENQEIQDEEEVEEGDIENEGEVVHYEDANFVSQVAAEALQSLSNTTSLNQSDIQTVAINEMIANEGTIINLPGMEGSYQIQGVPQDGTYQIQGVPQAMEGGVQGDNTVLIVQIVNPQDGEEVPQEYQVQEIIEATDITSENLPEEVQAYVETLDPQTME
ncbi:hypothetical protein FSP39_024850 [Pinctada imbricata]|uniref:C2H2-type domain-containing protein n=1 Tax=Pinctada imbricata TaxID=66713 RepID=A0AA89BZX3_PINIB|nr:hypothetical protein FSP39_024850 [Pinctada imbricata]